MTNHLLNGQSFAALGVESASLNLTNQAADTFSFSIPKSDVGQASKFAYGSAVKVTENGQTIFLGRITETPESSQAKSASHDYSASGAWWELERLPYSQMVDSYEGGSGVSRTPRPHPAVKIGRAENNDRANTMEILSQMVAYASEHDVNLSVGSLIPGVLVPEWSTHSRSVAEIIRQVMAWHPDAVLWFSYAGNTAKLNVSNRETAAQEMINADAGRPLTGLDTIVRRDDMAPENVVISWETTQNEVVDDYDTKGVNHPEEEKHFRLYSESYPNDDIKPGTLFFTLPATAPGGGRPWKANQHLQPISTRPIPEPGDKDKAARQWWLDHSPLQEFVKYIGEEDLALPSVDSDDIQTHKIEFVVDKGLTEVPPATNPNSTPLKKPSEPELEDYPNELVEGSITDWMRTLKHIRDLPVIASVSLALKETVYNTLPTEVRRRVALLRGRKVSFGDVNYLVYDPRVRIIATNARTKVYKATVSIEPGEPDPVTDPNGNYDPSKDPLVVQGLAERVYKSRTPAQWQGTVNLARNDGADRYMGSTLNIRKSGRSAWLSMKALVQSEARNLLTGEQVITFGPAEHLSPQDFTTLLAPARALQRASNEAAGMGSLDGETGVDPTQKNPVFGAQQNAARDVVNVTPPQSRRLQLSIEPAGEGKVKVFFGESSGMGHEGLIIGTNDMDWKEYAIDLRFFLKIEFTPTSTSTIIKDGGGGEQTVYMVAGGGESAVVTLMTAAVGAPLPAATHPSVNTETGSAAGNGVYYVPVGQASSGGIYNSIYGPLNIGFCPPNSIRVAEVPNVI